MVRVVAGVATTTCCREREWPVGKHGTCVELLRSGVPNICERQSERRLNPMALEQLVGSNRHRAETRKTGNVDLW